MNREFPKKYSLLRTGRSRESGDWQGRIATKMRIRRFTRPYRVTRSLDLGGRERVAIGRTLSTLAILRGLMLVPCFVIGAQSYTWCENIPLAKKTEAEKPLKTPFSENQAS